MLTRTERARGWVEFHCPEHGFVVAGPTYLVVSCGQKNTKGRRCNKKCLPK